MVRDVNINTITECGFKSKTINVPDNIAYMADGLQKMYKDGVLPKPPHLTQTRGIYKLHIKSENVDDNIIQQIKNIAINKKCVVKIDTCFDWIDIASETECIDKYFKED